MNYTSKWTGIIGGIEDVLTKITKIGQKQIRNTVYYLLKYTFLELLGPTETLKDIFLSGK